MDILQIMSIYWSLGASAYIIIKLQNINVTRSLVFQSKDFEIERYMLHKSTTKPYKKHGAPSYIKVEFQ